MSVCVCVCARAGPIWEKCLSIWKACVRARLVCVHACISSSCLGCAALWQCHRRGVLVCKHVRPQPPSFPSSLTPHHNMGDSHRPPVYSFFFFFFSSMLLHSPALPLVSPFQRTQLSECVRIWLSGFRVNFMQIFHRFLISVSTWQRQIRIVKEIAGRKRIDGMRQRSGAEVKQKWKRVI